MTNDSCEKNTAPSNNHSEDFYVVGVGASAGGLEALERFFKALPCDTGMAFVVIQHLSPDFKSLMDELLLRFTTMPVQLVDEFATLQPNRIYLLPPRKEMIIQGDTLMTYDKPSNQVLNLPINTFFRSLARERSEKAIGIVLSGTGSDGSSGIMDIHEMGGLVLAQTEASAKFDGMPRSAAATGCADAILPPEDMPALLIRYISNPPLLIDDLKHARFPDKPLTGIAEIIEKLRLTYDLDFNYYKPATITRRIERRISLNQLINIQDYCEKVISDPEELDKLYKDLLIGVTRFFRDEDAFAVIERDIIPHILEQVPDNEEVRLWVPGCATGEEPYSLAILLLEACEARHRLPSIKIFASDMHKDSLQTASEGLYPEDSLSGLSTERRNRFFIDQGNGFYRVTAGLRKLIIFSAHNLIKDPPFTKIDLVSCRNLMIYLQPPAQTKALAAFHFALKTNGFLFLGPSEGTGELSNEFDVIDRQWKIFRKLRDTRLPSDVRMSLPPAFPRASRQNSADIGLARAYDALLERYIPNSILVNEKHEVLHVFGNAGKLLKFPVGRSTQELVSLLSGELRIAVASALQSAQRNKTQIIFQGVRQPELDECVRIKVIVDPISERHGGLHYFMVIFEEEQIIRPSLSSDTSMPFVMEDEVNSRIQQLEQELQHTQESLQATVEELETSNEELQASNEELLASNEELQSTNEELHSVNEELYSVNAEHEEKIRELDAVTSDLSNLMRSTNIGSIFLTNEGHIRLFTPEATRMFNLMPQDVGRDIRHITSRIEHDTVFQELVSVMTSQETSTQKVTTPEGETFLRKIFPYYDLDKAPVGVVISMVDITDLTRTENKLTDQTRFLTHITNHLPGLVSYWDHQLICRYANAHYVEWLGVSAEKMVGKAASEIFPAESLLALQPHIDQALRGNRQTFERMITKPNGQVCYTLTSYIPDIVDEQVLGFIVLVIDITQQKLNEFDLQTQAKLAQEASRAKSEFVANISHELRTPMNVVLGMAQLLQETGLPNTDREYVEQILVAGKNLLGIINEILDFSKIEAGKMELDQHPFWLRPVINNAGILAKAQLSAKPAVKFVLDDASQSNAYYFGDSGKLVQVLTNLLTNAIKFTEQGQITLSVRVQELSSKEHRVIFTVQDTGIGIPVEAQEKLFTPFTQADASMTRRFGGTGLGLAICKRIVNRMGGEIGFESTEDVGSRFWLSIPLCVVPSEGINFEHTHQEHQL